MLAQALDQRGSVTQLSVGGLRRCHELSGASIDDLRLEMNPVAGAVIPSLHSRGCAECRSDVAARSEIPCTRIDHFEQARFGETASDVITGHLTERIQ